MSSPAQPAQVPLDGILSLYLVSCTAQLGIICDQDVKQDSVKCFTQVQPDGISCSSLVKPCWLPPITSSLFSMCFSRAFRRISSMIFPSTEVRLICLLFPESSFFFLLENGGSVCPFPGSGTSPDCHDCSNNMDSCLTASPISIQYPWTLPGPLGLCTFRSIC